MSKLVCFSCGQSKATLKKDLHCGICQVLLCKDCTQFLEDSFFSFLKKVPDDLAHTTYCVACYEQKVAPSIAPYEEIMARAKDIYVFYKQDKNIPIIRSSKNKLIVADCPDRRETILRLAFFAAEQSSNAIIQVDLIPKKIRIDGYQTTSWSGTGFPAMIRESRLVENIS
ncbi:MAG: hypothetical protein ACD_73C00346G0002 [uncultured bacterium]|nr:MAG: hypothetical protein ACD_73C00346G0002 [uncultured bacterium]